MSTPNLAQAETVESADELEALPYGTVVVSPNYMDAYSRFEWGSRWGLMNVATGHKTTPAEIGSDFLPVNVIYRAAWAKS